ncbi:MAG: hypothetical protein V3V86_04355, partial [Gammaproteobacteria bacterium]
WVQRQIQAQNDDAEEVVSNGNIDVSSTDLDFDSTKISGMRFTDIPVTKGQKILEARIVFAADSSQSGATTLRFRGETSADAAVFVDAPNNISKRIRTTASVDWVPADQTAGAQYTSPDLSAIVQEIINGAGWLPGNALALFEEHVSGGARREMTWDLDKLKAPVLRLKIQGPLATTGAGQRTVRTVLKELVDGLDHNGHTPIVDTLYEAARYYAGADVLYGAHRAWDRDQTFQPDPNSGSSNPAVRRNTRVSHPGSWSGPGTSIDQPGNCTDDDLNNVDCAYETIKGNATYTSPIESNCQSNFLILLTDGIANHNHSEAAIKTYTGVPTCGGGVGNQACGLELVKWMHDTDQSPVPGEQNVFTYTIGFNFSSKWLVDLATAGGGKFHEASTADELAREVTSIFADILNRSTSFAAPTLSVNAFNKLFHRSDVYFSLFKPSAAVRWEGNLKKYQLCSSTDALNNSNWPKDQSGNPKACADLGEVLDSDADPAVIKDPADPDLGRIRDSAESFWSGVADGSEIKVGGAGLEIPAEASRRVLTYTGTAAPNYSTLDNVTHRVASAGGGDQGILKGLTGTKAERTIRTQILFGDLALASTDADREEVIDWMLGTDVDGLEDVPSLASAGRRFAFQDPLHSSAVAVTFGGTEAEPMIKLFVGTNDGGLRATNASNGVEEWIFYPQSTLARQKELRDNFAGKHIYGIDGTPSVWTNDRDGDGIIEAGSDLNSDGFIDETEGDFVRLIVGMRRGGRNLYAVDVTPTTAQTSAYSASPGQQTNEVPPTYMWRIEGGVGGFDSLGQTWARPRIAKLAFGTATVGESYDRTTMILSGGYDEFQDGGFGTGGNGNAIYFVDPFDGSLLFVISGSDHGISNQVVVPGMDYPIPSDVALMDSDGDGKADRIYVGDTGGQMWRIDLGPDLDAGSATIKPVVGKLATVSNNTDPADKRKFFYPPDVVRVTDGAFSSGGAYDLVVAVTGNRSHPLDETVQDRIYAFRDEQTYSMSDTDDDNFADSYTTLQGALADPSTTGDLLNVTDVLDFTVAANLTDLESANGWFIDLEGSGEKGLAAPVILDGKIFFTTYLPEKVIDPANCSIQEGAGRLYAVDVLNGNAVQNWDGVGDDSNLTKSDRTYGLGSGIPSQA